MWHGHEAVAPRRAASRIELVNDVHGKINPTRVTEVVPVNAVADVVATLRRAARLGRAVSIAGARHAMGGQQFGLDTINLDMRGLDRVLDFDRERGTITVQGGIDWPKLMRAYFAALHPGRAEWGIRQKQTGADHLTIGGAVSANIHGRGLRMKPFVEDLVEVEVVNAAGELVRCSRTENPELFRLVVGGYGLFGVIVSAKLKLVRRHKLERVVSLLSADELADAFQARIDAGFTYGDFQFEIDPASHGFLRRGVFSCYRPVPLDTPIRSDQIRLSMADWGELLFLAHVDKRAAFQRFADFYLASSGQIYWSDTHQLNVYLDDYHTALDKHLGTVPASEVITEIYVPRDRLAAYLDTAREYLRAHGANLIYGTIRLIERDDESFLAWAREPYACVIFNLHTPHTPAGVAETTGRFRDLLDLALPHRGSFFLTYYRFATARQLLACYPQFPDFLRLKRRHDPAERFQSTWYRHHRDLLATL
jgi:FAD/FMN-containing dehydrogenase